MRPREGKIVKISPRNSYLMVQNQLSKEQTNVTKPGGHGKAADVTETRNLYVH